MNRMKLIDSSAYLKSIKKITTIRNLKNRNSLHIFENNDKFNVIWDCFVGTKITTNR